MFNTSFNTISVISWQSVLLVEETRDNRRPVTSHWQTVSRKQVHLAMSVKQNIQKGGIQINSNTCEQKTKTN